MRLTKKAERWAPFVLGAAILLLWQLGVMLFRVPDFIFPSPWQIALQFAEFQAPLLDAAWKTFWVTMLGFGLAIVVGVLLGFLIGSARIAYAALVLCGTAYLVFWRGESGWLFAFAVFLLRFLRFF